MREPCYALTQEIGDIAALEEVLENYYPREYRAWTDLYGHNGESRYCNCHPGQMFYAKYPQFKEYCSFLFDALFKVYEKIGNVDRSPYDKRYLAFLGERLLSVYLLSNNVSYETASVLGKQSKFSYTLRKVQKILNISERSLLYKIAKLFWGYKGYSSYKRE